MRRHLMLVAACLPLCGLGACTRFIQAVLSSRPVSRSQGFKPEIRFRELRAEFGRVVWEKPKRSQVARKSSRTASSRPVKVT